uniref:ANK_REP_REGION domain-containing protein n=1 Tax=Schistocephalus solidus TaxID=70667 RepID=A0A183SBD2_SCHSO
LQTALHYAAKAGNIRSLDLLVKQYRADVNTQSKAGVSTLPYALSSQSEKCRQTTGMRLEESVLLVAKSTQPRLLILKHRRWRMSSLCTECGGGLLRNLSGALKQLSESYSTPIPSRSN